MLTSAVTVVEPSHEPILLDDAKRFLRIDDDSLDQDVELMIATARADVELATGLRLLAQEVEFRAAAFVDLAHLPIAPVSAVIEIRFRDASGSPQLLDPATYRLVGGVLDRGIVAAIGATLPAMRAGEGSIVARLSVGYGPDGRAVPPTLRWAMLALMRGKWDDKPVDIEPQIVNFRVDL